ncbi:hypothetical protein [Sporanaerobacter sp.]|jgi:hypothetical protein|uniref:hypothetical protein n=1 Tax=Sporanaerobacter sp. TaxID=2010183 RepID=UPI003A0FD9DB
MKVLLSIKPEYAQEIFEGEKYIGIDEINSVAKVVKNKLTISWLAVLLWLASIFYVGA